MKWVLALLASTVLVGCGFLRSSAESQTHSVTTVTGTVNGQQVDLTLDKRETSQAETKTSLDTKDFWSILSTILQSFGGGTGIMAIIMAIMKHREVEYHKKDAAEGWDNYKESKDNV